MKIPKIFGNKVVLITVALALILIVIISLINVGKMAFTGFASSDDKGNINNKALEDNSVKENKKNEPALLITVTDNPADTTLEQSPSEFDSSENIQEAPRKGSSHSGGRSNGNSESSNPNNPETNTEGGVDTNTEQNGNANQNPQTSTKNKLIKKPKNLNLKKDGTELIEGEEFEGKIRLTLEKSNRKISEFDIEFTKDVDLSDIVADTDISSGKSFMHSTSGSLTNIDLYVPIKEGMDGIVVCSNADSYDEIYYGCSENPSITKEELLILPHPRVEISSDNLYFIVHGITGTGAVGVNVTNISSNRQNATPPGSLDAIAGNLSEITMPNASGTTQAWAGYIGNVSGTIQLADAGNNVMYNWSLASPEGEVLASTNNSISWNHIQCFNFTATGTYTDESSNGGSTNLHGTNLTILEQQFKINPGDLDGVEETFYLFGTGTHNKFYINANEFHEGECRNTRIFDSSGAGQDNHFEEVLLYEPTTHSVVFGSLLNEDLLGFDNRQHDFEMLVLEDGHLTNTATTMYYFYAVIF